MPRRATPDLPPERRQALEAELRVYGDLEARATLDKYVHVSRSYDAGMTTREIGAVYGVTSDTVSRWKDLGEQERKQRRPVDTES